MWVEATVQGREVLFLVDTGASYTTLTPWFAKLIGASPGAGAPTSSFQTAGGLQEMPFGVMPSLAFGGVTHKHVTFSLCESCGDADSSKRERPVVGLLGMNVLGRYKMNMDGEALTLFKSTRHQNRRADILPWVTLEAFEPGKRDGEEWPVSVKIKNHSARKFKRATAQVQCLTADQVVAWDVKLDGLKGGRSASETLMMKVSPKQCRQLDINVLDATW